MDNKDIVNLIKSFLFRCRICGRYFPYPQYRTCHRCYLEHYNVCFECYNIIHRTYCCCSVNVTKLKFT